jgi:hypothetical protein
MPRSIGTTLSAPHQCKGFSTNKMCPINWKWPDSSTSLPGTIHRPLARHINNDITILKALIRQLSPVDIERAPSRDWGPTHSNRAPRPRAPEQAPNPDGIRGQGSVMKGFGRATSGAVSHHPWPWRWGKDDTKKRCILAPPFPARTPWRYPLLLSPWTQAAGSGPPSSQRYRQRQLEPACEATRHGHP